LNNVTELPVSASAIAMSCRSRAAGAYADQPQSARSLHQRCPDVTRGRMAGSRGISASGARRADDRSWPGHCLTAIGRTRLGLFRV